MSHAKRINEVINILHDGRISPFDFFLELLDGTNMDFVHYRTELYKEGNNKLAKILDAVLADTKGRRKLYQWMHPHSLDIVCNKVSEEMDTVLAKERLPSLESITPEFIEHWHVPEYQENAPYLSSILSMAAETKTAKQKNKKKSPLTVNSFLQYSEHTLCLPIFVKDL